MRLAVVIVAGVLLAGCSSSAAKPRSFPNPVTIIGKAAGCAVDHGGASGELSVAGDFMVASCTYPSQETMTVKTFKTSAALKSDLAAYTPQDGEAAVAGADWVAYVSTAAGARFDPDALTIASQLGGKVQ